MKLSERIKQLDEYDFPKLGIADAVEQLEAINADLLEALITLLAIWEKRMDDSMVVPTSEERVVLLNTRQAIRRVEEQTR